MESREPTLGAGKARWCLLKHIMGEKYWMVLQAARGVGTVIKSSILMNMK